LQHLRSDEALDERPPEDTRELERHPRSKREADRRKREPKGFSINEAAGDAGKLAGKRRRDDLQDLQQDEDGGRIGSQVL
jgi:hypothetical protein